MIFFFFLIVATHYDDFCYLLMKYLFCVSGLKGNVWNAEVWYV